MAQAGLEGVTPAQLVSASGVLGAFLAVVVLATSRVPLIALLFRVFAGSGPWLLVRRRRSQRTVELRKLVPRLDVRSRNCRSPEPPG